jgi:hypothetical protein
MKTQNTTTISKTGNFDRKTSKEMLRLLYLNLKQMLDDQNTVQAMTTENGMAIDFSSGLGAIHISFTEGGES